jgi:quercetin dioxygenase-like cupin family protein
MPLQPTTETKPRIEAPPALPFSRFDLEEEIRRMRTTLNPGDHVSKTLVRAPDLRLVLMVLQKGVRIPEHGIEGSSCIQGLDGRVILTLPGERFEIGPGQLLMIEHDVPHALEAAEDSAVLLTISFRGHHDHD